MKNPFNLNIKSPCQENFQKFTPTAKGGFCGSCEKEVVDFTKMTSDEIIAFFKAKETQNVCGRFNNNQLKTYSPTPKRKKLSFISAVGLACLSLFSFGTAQAQNTSKASQSIGKDNSKVLQESQESNITVEGTVTENELPLPGVNIVLQGTTIGTSTDFDGNFIFPEKLKKGDVLLFSFLGKESKKVVVTNQDSVYDVELKIDMKDIPHIIMGKVATKEVYKSKRD
ncbi:carboxypeptidase-like regulatory domain-containing protein [Corallibacter sp.]|uniref:carboxypeptidase-like regulatory domain-containing protein n=1 Tax=Corallibacter sp. TaxID=2038084 RepID=UPI003AB8348C